MPENKRGKTPYGGYDPFGAKKGQSGFEKREAKRKTEFYENDSPIDATVKTVIQKSKKKKKVSPEEEARLKKELASGEADREAEIDEMIRTLIKKAK